MNYSFPGWFYLTFGQILVMLLIFCMDLSQVLVNTFISFIAVTLVMNEADEAY